jgi:hypothetical protein
MILTFNFPVNLTSFAPPSSAPRGTSPLTPNANNQVSVDISVFTLDTLLHAGFTLAPTVCTTANRPTYTWPGMPIFDSTLGTPAWRNAANTAWVNASGTTV